MNISKDKATTESSFIQQFAGRWHLQREIRQHTGETFSFTGEAVFSWQEEELHYTESGQVTAPGGAIFRAQRAYIWTRGDTHHIDVLFNNRRFFHRFSLLCPDAVHLCGEDHYTVRYELSQWPLWKAHWHVLGPRKDYVMTSLYQPL